MDFQRLHAHINGLDADSVRHVPEGVQARRQCLGEFTVDVQQTDVTVGNDACVHGGGGNADHLRVDADDQTLGQARA